MNPMMQAMNAGQLNNYIMQQKLNLQNKVASGADFEALKVQSLPQTTNFLNDPMSSNIISNPEISNPNLFSTPSELKNTLASPTSSAGFVQRNPQQILGHNQTPNAQYLQSMEQLKRLQALASQGNPSQQQLIKLQQLRIIKQMQNQKNEQFPPQQKDPNSSINPFQFNAMNVANRGGNLTEFPKNSPNPNIPVLNPSNSKSSTPNVGKLAEQPVSTPAVPPDFPTSGASNSISPTASQKGKKKSEMIAIPPTRVFSVNINNHKVELTMQQVFSMRSAAQQKDDQKTIDLVNNIAKDFIFQVQAILKSELESSSLKSPGQTSTSSIKPPFVASSNDSGKKTFNQNSFNDLNQNSGQSSSLDPNYNQNFSGPSPKVSQISGEVIPPNVQHSLGLLNGMQSISTQPNPSVSTPSGIDKDSTRLGSSKIPHDSKIEPTSNVKNVRTGPLNFSDSGNMSSNSVTKMESNSSSDSVALSSVNNSNQTLNININRKGVSANEASLIIKDIEQRIMKLHTKKTPIQNISEEDKSRIRLIVPMLARMFYQVEKVLPIVYMSSQNEDTIAQVLSMKVLFEDQVSASKRSIEARQQLEKLKQIDFSSITDSSTSNRFKLAAQKAILDMKNEFLLDWNELDSMRTKLIYLINDVKANINSRPQVNESEATLQQGQTKMEVSNLNAADNSNNTITISESPKIESNIQLISVDSNLSNSSQLGKKQSQQHIELDKNTDLNNDVQVLDEKSEDPTKPSKKRNLSSVSVKKNSNYSSESSDDDIPLIKKQALLTKGSAPSSNTNTNQLVSASASSLNNKLSPGNTPIESPLPHEEQKLGSNAIVDEENKQQKLSKVQIEQQAKKLSLKNNKKSESAPNKGSKNKSITLIAPGSIVETEKMISTESNSPSGSALGTPKISKRKTGNQSATTPLLSQNSNNKNTSNKLAQKSNTPLAKFYGIYNKSASVYTSSPGKSLNTPTISSPHVQTKPEVQKEPPRFNEPNFDIYWNENKTKDPMLYLERVQDKFKSAVPDEGLNYKFESLFGDEDFSKKAMGPDWGSSDFSFGSSLFSIPF
ncbi:hypothetical protein AYI68_g329 [Smittium mucronatum]|uniref:Uncharacterized protein n=1 Tax=Smittium mucronatum TaxID=133383 RepID=A0A1R0H8R1_9FUNG|nr:hypothetical protein AYI68_g329 [Smittium mucronatum]